MGYRQPHTHAHESHHNKKMQCRHRRERVEQWNKGWFKTQTRRCALFHLYNEQEASRQHRHRVG
ncbi:hypothetical protein GBAR_LOCUS2809, partial [Geodia barretti]